MSISIKANATITIIFLFLTFLPCKELFSQESYFSWEGLISDKNSAEKVPFASIRIFSEGRVFIFAANENGKANINYYSASKTDSVLITSIGYKPYKLSCVELQQVQRITLEQDILTLNEVVIKSKKNKKTKTIKLGNNTPLCYPIWSYHIPWGCQAALFIKNEKTEGQIITIRYYMKDIIGRDYHLLPFRVRVYNLDTNSNAPGEDLLDEYLIVSLDKDKGNWIEVDVSQYHITMPKNGVFVGLEVLPVEYYLSNNIVTESTISTTTPDGKPAITGGLMIGSTKRSKNSKKPYDSWANWGTKEGWLKGDDRRQQVVENEDYLINIIVEKRK